MRSVNNNDPYLPQEAKIVDRIQESPTIITLRLQFTDPDYQKLFQFQPGQFNMLSLHGVGEVPMSIVSDPETEDLFDHTIRIVGRVTTGLSLLKKGDHLGVRGPYGHAWPLENSKGKDIVIVTGGLGCAPSVSLINYIIKRRHNYGTLYILQGIKHSDDFIFKKRYEKWRAIENTRIYIAADVSGPKWPFSTGYVTDFISQLPLIPGNTVAMMCGPEAMMSVATNALSQKNISDSQIFLSMERNMACAIGHCGHCQYGKYFVCKDGPIFPYSQIKPLFQVEGF